MIGRIEFDWTGGRTLQATLEDDGTWSCSDRVARTSLNTLAPSSAGYLPRGGQLRDGAAVRSGRIIKEVEEPFDPNVDY
jgi:hypothetical protein